MHPGRREEGAGRRDGGRKATWARVIAPFRLLPSTSTPETPPLAPAYEYRSPPSTTSPSHRTLPRLASRGATSDSPLRLRVAVFSGSRQDGHRSLPLPNDDRLPPERVPLSNARLRAGCWDSRASYPLHSSPGATQLSALFTNLYNRQSQFLGVEKERWVLFSTATAVLDSAGMMRYRSSKLTTGVGLEARSSTRASHREV